MSTEEGIKPEYHQNLQIRIKGQRNNRIQEHQTLCIKNSLINMGICEIKR